MTHPSRFYLALFLLTLLSTGCGGGGGSGSQAGTVTPPTTEVTACLSELNANVDEREAVSQLNGGILYPTNSRDTLNYHKLSSGQLQLITTNGVAVYSPSPDGRKVIYGDKPTIDFQVYDLTSGDIQTFDDLRFRSWTRDSRSAIVSTEAQYFLLELESGNKTSLEFPMVSVSFSSAESGAFALSSNTQFSIWNSAGEKIHETVFTDLSYSHRYLKDESTLSDDGNYFTFMKFENADYSIYLYDINNDTTTLVGTVGAISNTPYSWAKDSQHLAIPAYLEGQDKLTLLNPTNGTSIDLMASLGGWSLIDLKWAGDGASLAFWVYNDQTDDDRLYASNINGTITHIAPDADPSFYLKHYAWSPRGRYLAFVSETNTDDRGRLYVADTINNCVKAVDQSGTNEEELGWEFFWSPSGKYIYHTLRDSDYKEHHFVVHADGSNQYLLGGIINSPETSKIHSFEWLPTSDSIFFEQRDENNTNIEALNIIEVSSLNLLKILTDGERNFGSQATLLPEPDLR